MKPLQNQVLLKVELEQDKTTKSGIILLNLTKKREDKGEVISFGNNIKNFKKGDIVKFYYGAGYKVNHKGVEHLLIDNRNILGTLLVNGKFKPNLDFVVIDRDAPLVKTVRGIIIPDTEQKPSMTGTIVAIGDECKDIEVGQKAWYDGEQSRSLITIDDKEYLIMKQDEIFGTA